MIEDRLKLVFLAYVWGVVSSIAPVLVLYMYHRLFGKGER